MNFKSINIIKSIEINILYDSFIGWSLPKQNFSTIKSIFYPIKLDIISYYYLSASRGFITTSPSVFITNTGFLPLLSSRKIAVS